MFLTFQGLSDKTKNFYVICTLIPFKVIAKASRTSDILNNLLTPEMVTMKQTTLVMFFLLN